MKNKKLSKKINDLIAHRRIFIYEQEMIDSELAKLGVYPLKKLKSYFFSSWNTRCLEFVLNFLEVEETECADVLFNKNSELVNKNSVSNMVLGDIIKWGEPSDDSFHIGIYLGFHKNKYWAISKFGSNNIFCHELYACPYDGIPTYASIKISEEKKNDLEEIAKNLFQDVDEKYDEEYLINALTDQKISNFYTYLCCFLPCKKDNEDLFVEKNPLLKKN